MISVHEEPPNIQKEFGNLMERCHFCLHRTRWWTADKKTPVCQTCAAIFTDSDMKKPIKEGA